MNSKNILLILISLIAVSCGVKGDPMYPKGAMVPSLLENYEDIKTDQPLNETKNPKQWP